MVFACFFQKKVVILHIEKRYINNQNPKSRKGNLHMKKFFVQFAQTTTGTQPTLRSLTKGNHLVCQYETTDFEDAINVAQKEIELSDFTNVEELEYNLTDDEYNQNVSWIEILETDEDGEEIIGWVDFDSPRFWVGE